MTRGLGPYRPVIVGQDPDGARVTYLIFPLPTEDPRTLIFGMVCVSSSLCEHLGPGSPHPAPFTY